MDKIFTNFNPLTAGSGYGFQSTRVNINIGDRKLEMFMQFNIQKGTGSRYNPVVDFGGYETLRRRLDNGYWSIIKNEHIFRLGVKENNYGTNVDFILDYLGY